MILIFFATIFQPTLIGSLVGFILVLAMSTMPPVHKQMHKRTG